MFWKYTCRFTGVTSILTTLSQGPRAIWLKLWHMGMGTNQQDNKHGKNQ